MQEAIARIQVFEQRFLTRTKDGLCVDWMAVSRHDLQGFKAYIADREFVRRAKKVPLLFT